MKRPVPLTLPVPEQPEPAAVVDFLHAHGVRYTTRDGWALLNAHEHALGAEQGRERIKVVERDAMLDASGA